VTYPRRSAVNATRRKPTTGRFQRSRRRPCLLSTSPGPCLLSTRRDSQFSHSAALSVAAAAADSVSDMTMRRAWETVAAGILTIIGLTPVPVVLNRLVVETPGLRLPLGTAMLVIFFLGVGIVAYGVTQVALAAARALSLAMPLGRIRSSP
jgi:hypothetical protein